ncbi:site-specific integrase [Guyparkeria sp. SCN-R1]|uniref:site-specific integrase n=1 Tax=Guyparkeria sp. SCN-R1 TaxID=2341113 RepID=UPI000F64988F|nr:site-specific integrase [Guyparkeria sp. SCN-R1]RRQ20335.1 site-specific integrase [Guyparkeria sp. SCN-R1]
MSPEQERRLDQQLLDLGFTRTIGDKLWRQYREILGWVLEIAQRRKRFTKTDYDTLIKSHRKLERPSRRRHVERLLTRLQHNGWQCELPPTAVKPPRDLSIPPTPEVAALSHQVYRLEHLVRRQWPAITKEADGRLFTAALLLVTRCGASDQVSCGILSRLRVCDVDELPGVEGRIRTPIHGAADYDNCHEFIPPRPLRDLLVQQRKRRKKHGHNALLFSDAIQTLGETAEPDRAVRRSLSRYLKALNDSNEVKRDNIELTDKWFRLAQAGRYVPLRYGVPPLILELLRTYPLPKRPLGLELFKLTQGTPPDLLIPPCDSPLYLPPNQVDHVTTPSNTNPEPLDSRDDDWSPFARITLAEFLVQLVDKNCTGRNGTLLASKATTIGKILHHALDKADSREPSTRSVLHLALHWVHRKLHVDGIKISSARKYVGQVFPDALFDHIESRDMASWDEETIDELTIDLMTRPSWSSKTQHDFVISWMQFLRFCCEVGVLNQNDLPQLASDDSIAARPGRRALITPQQFTHLIHHIEHDTNLSDQEREEYKGVLILGFYGGTRASEVLDFQLGDFVIFNPQNGAEAGLLKGNILNSKTPSGRRVLPLYRLLPEDARVALQSHIAKRQHQAISIRARGDAKRMPLFGPLVDDRRPTWAEVIKSPLQYMRRVLQTDIDYHGLRHCAASWLLLRAYLLTEPELGSRLAQGGHPLLAPDNNDELRRMIDMYAPEKSDTREKILVFLAKFLGHANVRTLVLTYAHTLGPIHSHALDRASTWHPRTDRIRVPD